MFKRLKSDELKKYLSARMPSALKNYKCDDLRENSAQS